MNMTILSTRYAEENTMKKYLKLQNNLFLNDLCRGLSIALEPGCCGGEDNCLKILDQLSKVFAFDFRVKRIE